jgi:hypothetical protein
LAYNPADISNWLCLSTQVPMHIIYLTSGPSMRLSLMTLDVELRHATEAELQAQNLRLPFEVRPEIPA